MPAGTRRWNAWGFEGERFDVAAATARWLEARVGRGDPLAAIGENAVAAPLPRELPPLGAETLTDTASRLRAACGMSFPDLVALRTGADLGLPDAVVRPADAVEIVALLRAAASSGVRVVVRGGGTSVVGGVTVARDGAPTVVLLLDRLAGLLALDPTSRLATFGAGTLGPAVEAALAPHGMRLGHEPQSFELSTVGGWVATRSAGQRSTGVGKIDDLVAGVAVATAEGVWRLAAQPASAAGPELRRLVIGSEGRLGVITEATLRVRPRPAVEDGVAVLIPSLDAGIETCRELVQNGVPVEVLRLSDADETGFAAALVEASPLAAMASRLIFGTRRYGRSCALLLGWTGEAAEVRRARTLAAEVWRAHGGLRLGRSSWRRWRRDRFRLPYLRDALLGAGWGVDTFETAAVWSALPGLHAAVGEALATAAASTGTRVAVLCHVSHAYADGASLYFTFLWPLARGAEVAQWTALKRAATDALLAAGGTLTHHHGVGTMHVPWLAAETGGLGIRLLAAAAAVADPSGTLNPGVLVPAPGPRPPDPRKGGG